MGWNEAKAYVPVTGAPVRVGIQQIGMGNPRLMVSLGAALFKKLGSPETVNVFVGDEEDAGKLLLQFDDEGSVEITAGKRGGAFFKLNQIAGMPSKKMKMAGVKFEELEGEETGNAQISITLPW